MTFDRVFGKGSLKKLTTSLDYKDVPLVSHEEQEDQSVHLRWKSEEINAVMVLRFTDSQFIYQSFNVEPQGQGFLSRVCHELAKFSVANKIDLWMVPAIANDADDKFISLGFEWLPTSNGMKVEPKKVLEYAKWKRGKGPEPKWHKDL